MMSLRSRSALSSFALMLVGCGAGERPRQVQSAPTPEALHIVEHVASRSLAGRFAATAAGFSPSGGGHASMSMSRRPDSPAAALGTLVGSDAAQTIRIAPLRRPDLSLLLTPLDHAQSPAELHEGRLVYRDVATSTDAVMTAGDSFTELAWVLRDAQAPHTFRFRVDAGSLSHLIPEGDDGLALVDENARARLHVARPFAVDAAGKRREARMELSEDVLSVTVDTAGLTFPVVLDPYIATGVWTLAPVEPTKRSGAAMAVMNDTIVLFGGKTSTGLLNDTWIYNGNRWSLAKPTTTPPARQGGRMAALGGKLILFGGTGKKKPTDSLAPALTDTWSFDGTNWSEMKVAGGDACNKPLANAVSVGSKIAFAADGTSSAGGTVMCVFDGTAWTVDSRGFGPPDVSRAIMAANGTTIVYPTVIGATYTWTDAAGWKMADPGSGTGNAPWDMGTAIIGTVGGSVTLASSVGVDTWTGSSWTTAAFDPGSPELPFWSLSPAFATYHDKINFFSTHAGGGSELLWTVTKVGYIDVATAADAPTTTEPLAFGPWSNKAVYIDRTAGSWQWDGAAWSEIKSKGPGAIGVIADEGKSALYYGGTATWRWDGASWSTLSPAHSPTLLPQGLASVGGQLVLVGFDATGLVQAWSWDGSDWHQGQSAPNFVVSAFGGTGASSAPGVMLGVSFSGAPQQYGVDPAGAITPTTGTPPSIDEGYATAVNPFLGSYALLYAEHESSPTSLSLWNGKAWREVAASGLPDRSAALVRNVGGKPTLFGGIDGDGFAASDLFVLQLGLEDGVACGAASDCHSGFCAQGVCCNEKCDAAAHSCALPQTLGTCAPVQAVCKDAVTLVGGDGTSATCSPFVCRAGACVNKCATSDDCAGGFACDTGSGQCQTVAVHSGSGGCSTSLHTGAAPAWWLLVGIAGFAAARRRRGLH